MFEPVIGLEIHAQLLTESKIFCGCSTRFGAPPNTNVCAVCLGLPGALPVLNRRAVEFAVRAAHALNCAVQTTSIFARKNYFYPDLPKGYQISQYERPIATGGFVEYPSAAATRRVGITRVHLEEDAGKSLHEGFSDSDRRTYLDFNRSGVPLIEIVSEPDLRSAAEAGEFFSRLRAILVAIGVNDGNMEEGSLRCDANVSVRPSGAPGFGTKAEVKNLNSFRYVQRALEYEIDRQIGVLREGGRVVQETRLWDVGAGRTVSMRSKEEAHDYRYFPEPDVPPLECPRAPAAAAGRPVASARAGGGDLRRGHDLALHHRARRPGLSSRDSRSGSGQGRAGRIRAGGTRPESRRSVWPTMSAYRGSTPKRSRPGWARRRARSPSERPRSRPRSPASRRICCLGPRRGDGHALLSSALARHRQPARGHPASGPSPHPRAAPGVPPCGPGGAAGHGAPHRPGAGRVAGVGYWITGLPQPACFGALTAVASLIPAVGTLSSGCRRART